jgi:class 3 adenylate cyclase
VENDIGKQRLITLPAFPALVAVGLWVCLFFLPVVFLGGLIREITLQDEQTLDLRARHRLTREMNRYLSELGVERRLETFLDVLAARIGFPTAIKGRARRLLPGADLPHTPAQMQEHILAQFRQYQLPEPLLLFTYGPDCKEFSLFANPRFFSPGRRPSDTASRHLGALWSGLLDRAPRRFAEHLTTLQRRARDRGGVPAFFDLGRKILRSILGEHAVLPSRSSGLVSFFSPRFGSGKLWVGTRFLTDGTASSAPLIGGFALVTRHGDLPRSFLLGRKKNLERGWARGKRHFSPRFITRQESLYFVVRSPVELDPLTLPLLSRSERRPIYLWTRSPLSERQSALRAQFGWLSAASLFWLAFGAWGLRRLQSGNLHLPFRIRGRLLIALGFAVMPPFCIAILLSSSYEGYRERHEAVELSKEMGERLELLESQVMSHLTGMQEELVLRKDSLLLDIDAAPGNLQKRLEAFLVRSSAEMLHLLLWDGRECVVSRPGSNLQLNPALLTKMLDISRTLAIRIFLEYRTHEHNPAAPSTPTSYFRPDRITLAQKLWDTVALATLMEGQRSVINPKISGYQDGPASLFKLTTPLAPTVPGQPARTFLRGVLFVLQRNDEIIPLFLNSLPDVGWTESSARTDYDIRSAVFRCEGDSLLTRESWPPAGVHDQALIQAAREGLSNPWKPQTPDAAESFSLFRRFKGAPFVAAAVVQRRDRLQTWHWTSTWALRALYLACLIGLTARFLERRYVVPIQELARAGQAVAAGDFQRGVHLPDGGEFQELGAEFNRMCAGLREGRLLSRFVSTEAYSDIVTHGSRDFAPGGEKKNVSVLFSHIAAFDSWTQRLTHPELLSLLNEYVEQMELAIIKHGGVIDKYIGDAVMAVFHETPGASTATNAVGAALEMRRRQSRLNDRLADRGQPPMSTGIGIATGTAISGKIGSHLQRLDFTVIGDVVNLAARLEAQRGRAKPRGILIDTATRAGLDATFAATLAAEDLGELTVKGKAQQIRVFQILPEADA